LKRTQQLPVNGIGQTDLGGNYLKTKCFMFQFF
jgi:hypothetical protein